MKKDVTDYGALVCGKPVKTCDRAEVRCPFDQSITAIVHRAGPGEIERAIAGAARAFEITRKMPSWQRSQILEKISAGIAERKERFARLIALEAAKPINPARGEVDRAIFTFKVASEEARRINGEIIPLDWAPGAEGRTAHVRHVPLGPILGIMPFNFPLNLVAHKVAPAIAAGDPIIIRPSSQTPSAALELGELAVKCGWPPEAISVLPSSTADAQILVHDERLRLLSFTGSPSVGWTLKTQAGRKRVTLELGGNAAVIVHHDADVDYAAERIVLGGFSHAGQSCISVQRVYIHEHIFDEFRDDLVRRVKALKLGDPLDDATDVGPVIDADAAERIDEWLREAIDGGAEVLTGGKRDGLMWQPTVLANVCPEMRISCQEAFAPFVVLCAYSDVYDAIHAANSSDYGLQAGLFTHDLRVIEEAFEEIEVGGLIVNDASAFRMDHMPYGGAKQSGMGREGLRYAIQEMSEMKLLMVYQGPVRD